MKIKICNWNINGIRSLLKKESVKKHNILSFENFCDSFDIVALQEIKVNEKSVNVLYDNFKSFKWKYYAITNNSRSGVSIFSKIKPDLIIVDPFVCSGNCLGRYIEAHFNKFILINVYQPNSGAGLKTLSFRIETWDVLFRERIRKIITENPKKEIIICGDFNVIHDPDKTYNFKSQYNKLAGVTEVEMKNFKELLKQCKLIDVFSKLFPGEIKYTYFSQLFKAREYNKGMTIDYILSSRPKNKTAITNIKIMDEIYGSDHIPISFDIN